MQDRMYYVQDRTGKWSPQVSENELYDYARNGFIVPSTAIAPYPDGSPFAASDHPGVAAIFRQKGISTDPPKIKLRPEVVVDESVVASNAKTIVTQKENTKEAFALTLSLMSLIAWIVPIFGIPISIGAGILAFPGVKSNRMVSVVALAICGLTLFAGIINSIVGAVVYGATYQRMYDSWTHHNDQINTVPEGR